MLTPIEESVNFSPFLSLDWVAVQFGWSVSQFPLLPTQDLMGDPNLIVAWSCLIPKPSYGETQVFWELLDSFSEVTKPLLMFQPTQPTLLVTGTDHWVLEHSGLLSPRAAEIQ